MVPAGDLIPIASSLLAIGVTRLLRAFIPGSGEHKESERRRVLVVKLDELGDVLMALPLVTELRRDPRRRVTLVVNSGIKGIFGDDPELEVLAVDVRCAKWLKPLLLPLRYARFVRQHDLKGAVDVCLVPRRDTDAAYSTSLGYLTRPRRLVSFSEKSGRRKSIANRGFNGLLTDIVAPPSVQHETSSNLALLSAMGVEADSANVRSTLSIEEAARRFAAEALAGMGRPIVAICPSSGHSELKQWGAERFGELARRLSEAGYSVVLVGSPADEELGVTIMGSGCRGCLNLIGKTSLQQLAAVIERCAAFVGNDAGPMHVASALQIATVGIFGSSCEHMFGPWSPVSSVQVNPVPCSPCVAHTIDRCKACVQPSRICFDGLSVEQVLEAVLRMVAKPEGAGSGVRAELRVLNGK